MHSVNYTMDVLQQMEFGEVNRDVSFTSINNQSSRSHRTILQSIPKQQAESSTPRRIRLSSQNTDLCSLES
ncbi:hypothetical protein Bca52824_064991 [Brassica carinata]|uniref:Uncharacterized protein n=1 Tax=Brassica carinata TaxID=52824 RepID=A0A8X7UAP8_BRACI|nr:hypothetical protein Bca52824_064991 [Brassica carinata]